MDQIITRPSIARGWRPGYSMPQQLYIAPEAYEADLRLLGQTQWQLVDHQSRIPKPGDYFLFQFGSESIIVVRDKSDRINAFYNVCRHRGSRICLEEQGNKKSFTCPYHAWTYGLDGALRKPLHMPNDFDPGANGLRKANVGVFEGMIFLNLADEAPDFESFVAPFREYLAPHGLADARIAARHNCPNDANWKLVVENFYECYHCRQAHKAYCSVHDGLKMLAMGAGPGSANNELTARYEPVLKAWEEKARAQGAFTGMFVEDETTAYHRAAARLPISDDALTESMDGKPVAPLMGSFREYDGGQTGCVMNAVSVVLANNDYTALIRITPRGAISTDMEMIWLVKGDANEGVDYDRERLMELWVTTLNEDKTITEDNQKGVLSKVYTPGVLSDQEQRIADFGRWYVRRLGEITA